jgi:epsilon-lactone hydrolase
MTAQTLSPRVRRPELERAFQHGESLFDEADLSGIIDPKVQWLTAMRGTIARYGDVDLAVSFEGIAFTPVIINGVHAEWVTAEGTSNTRRIVWIHGGGWSAGSPQDYRTMSATLARLSGSSILMVDYRLAPDNPYPAGLDDCVTAYQWALKNGPESEQSGKTDQDPAERMGLLGDSAGGNLAAATCLRLLAAGAQVPDRLVLVAGTLDNVSMPERIGDDDPICTTESLSNSVHFYLTPPHSASDPYVSPVFAATETLAKFPPTLIQVSTSEALLYDSKKFANRLETARVRVNLSLWPELPHVWHAFLGLFPEAKEALSEIADFIKR